MLYARIVDGLVVETVDLPDGFELESLYPSELAAEFVTCGSTDGVGHGWTYDGSNFSAPPPIAAPSLVEIQSDLKARIDAAAEEQRLRYITPGAGQAMTYSQKADEAIRFLAADDPVATEYPMLNAEVGITSETIADVAAVVNAAFSQWQVIGAAIEGIRLSNKKAVDEAPSSAAAQAIFAAVAWPNS